MNEEQRRAIREPLINKYIEEIRQVFEQAFIEQQCKKEYAKQQANSVLRELNIKVIGE